MLRKHQDPIAPNRSRKPDPPSFFGCLGMARWLTPAMALLLATTACRGPEEPRQPNIVFVTLCSFRLDHMGFYGYPRPTTPFLDHLAAEGTTFDRVFSASSWTKPSTASLITGLTPNVHHLVDSYPIRKLLSGQAKVEDLEPPRILPDVVETLPESLQRIGYATGCRVNNINAGEFFNLTQGCEDQLTSNRYPTHRMLDDLSSFLEQRDPGQPFFYWLFSLDAHVPYTPTWEDFQRLDRHPDRQLEKADFHTYLLEMTRSMRLDTEQQVEISAERQQAFVDAYDAALVGLDRTLSRLPEILARAGVAEDTIIVVTADHGESFFEPGRDGPRLTTHGFDLAEALVRIPMIFHGPGIPKGRRVDTLARSIDLFPTLLDLAGTPEPAIAQGRSLVPLLGGDAAEEPEPIYAFMSRSNGRHHALHDGRFKLQLRMPDRLELFDTELDRYETKNLQDERPDVVRRLHRELRHWLEQEDALRQVVGETGNRELSPAMREHLEALGYL